MLNGCFQPVANKKNAVEINRNPSEPHIMLRLAVPAGNTEYKHMSVSAGRTQMRNQIDGMDQWTAGWIYRWIDGNGSVDLWKDGWEPMFVLNFIFPQDGRQSVP